MTHYDPLRELDELDEPTVEALADRYDIDSVDDPDISDAMADLAAALNEIGPETLDDTAKFNTVATIIAAMQKLDAINESTTELLLETVTEEYEGNEYDIDRASVRVQHDS